MNIIKKSLIAAAVIVAAVVCLVGARWYSDNRMPNFRKKVDLYVYPGMTVQQVLQTIPDSTVIRRRSLERVCGKKFRSMSVTPGHYLIEKGKPSIYVPRMLKKGWQSPVNLVLSGTMRLKENIARKISSQLMLDSVTVINALNDSSLLASYGFTPADVFSLLMPDTYQLYWTASMKEVLDKQKAAYDAFWTPDNVEKAKAQGLTPKEVSILASIVSSESNYEPEYPSIAGVYLNRLHQGMKLQADPTIAYCYGFTLNRILGKHLTVDSPYNTYTHMGLPPGPICVPAKASLEAVLNPDPHDYMYFCASPAMDGTHRFASSFSEHRRNASEFQRALDARMAERAESE